MDPLGTGFTAPEGEVVAQPPAPQPQALAGGFVAPTSERLNAAPPSSPQQPSGFVAPQNEALAANPHAASQYFQQHPGMDPMAVQTAFQELQSGNTGPQRGTTPEQVIAQQSQAGAQQNGVAGNAVAGYLQPYQGLAGRFMKTVGQGEAALGFNDAAENTRLAAEVTEDNAPAQGSLAGLAGNIAGGLPFALAGQRGAILQGLNSAEMAYHQVEQQRQNGQDISGVQAAADVVGQGVLSYVMNRVGQKNMTGPLAPALVNSLLPEIKSVAGQIAARYAATGIIEGGVNTLNGIVANIVTKLTGVNPDQQATEGAGINFAVGALMGMAGRGTHELLSPHPALSAGPTKVPVPSPDVLESLKYGGTDDNGNVHAVVESEPQKATPPAQPAEANAATGPENVQAPQGVQGTGRQLLDSAEPKYRVNNGAESVAYPLDFESPEDKALFLATVPRKGRIAAEASAWLQEQGYKPEAIEHYGDELRSRIDELAKKPPAEGHPLAVPGSTDEAEETPQTPKVTPDDQRVISPPPKERLMALIDQKAEAEYKPEQEEAGASKVYQALERKAEPSYMPEAEAQRHDEVLGEYNPGAKRAEQIPQEHQEVLSVAKELTGKEAIPYKGGKGRGFALNGDLYYSLDRNKTPQQRREAIAHEATHWLQDNNPALVARLDRAIPEGTRQKLLDEYQRMYSRQEGKALPAEQHTREIQAMAVGRAFSRPSVARQVLQENPGAFTRAADAVMTKLRGLTSGGTLTNQIVSFLREAREQAKALPSSADRHMPETEKANFLPTPHEGIRQQAEDYAQEHGIPYHPTTEYAKVDEGQAGKIAEHYAAAKHEPENPEVRKSYDAFKQETLNQYEYLKKQGVDFEPWKGEGQPYKDSADMMADARDNKHLYFFQGGDMPEDHPLASKAPGTPYSYNDIFRAVHDYFGHAKEGVGFGPRGEENAWRSHSQLYSDEARPAMTNETRGQNSWVNYGPFGEANRANPDKTTYAEQKATLLPKEYNQGQREGQPSFLPGGTAAKSFMEEDVKPAMERVSEDMHDAWTGLRNLTGNQEGEGAAATKGILRERGAELQQRFDRINEAFDKTEKSVGSLPVAEQHAITDSAERGNKQSNPALQPVADAIRSLYDDRLKQIQKFKPDLAGIENYMGHAYENPQKAAKVLSELMTKGPLQGSKGFLKQRTIPFQSDAVAAGLKPVTDNPVTMMKLKIAAMDKYITAQQAFEDLGNRGLLKTIKARDAVPEGYAKIEDNIATTFAPPSRRGALQIQSYKVAPEPVASVINNYLSPGLRGDEHFGGAFKLGLGASNIMNQAQLGFSAFHALGTSINSMVSKSAIGLKNLAAGNFAEAGKNFASTAIAPFQDFFNGTKLLREWRKPGSTDPETAAMVSYLKKGGGRAGLDGFYDTGAADKFMEAVRKGNHIGAALRLPQAVLDFTSAPMMKQLVPRLKLGAFMDMARLELGKLGPGAGDDEIRSAAGKAWDSVDNRFGQLTYDNLFWNKAVKDIAMASTRSVGWNLGTIRELGGGAMDLGRAASRIALDRSLGNVELTHRMAYAASLPVVVGVIGGAIHYALTGQAPQELKDYFFPKTGQKDQAGHDVRLSLPTYMKDVYAYKDGALTTLTHKSHPMLNTVIEMLQNKDYYGTKIRNEDDPFIKQAIDSAKHVGQSFEPFGVREVVKMAGQGQGAKSLLPLFGVTEAGRTITNSPAELKAQEIMQGKIPQGSRTQAEADKAQKIAEFTQEMHNHNPQVYKDINDAVRGHQISEAEAKRIPGQAELASPLARHVSRMGVEDAFKVFALATDEEKKDLQPIIRKKLERAYETGSMTPDEIRQYAATLRGGASK